MKKGGTLERSIEAVHTYYLLTGVAKVHKVDPPVRIVGRRVIFLENPFLDYIGTLAGGQTIAIEAKETCEPRLELSGTKLTGKQSRSLDQWRHFGAIAFLLWWHAGEIRIVTPQIIAAEEQAGRASVRWRRAVPMTKSQQHPADYLPTLRELGF